jgi:hypothetical protein
LRRNSSRIWSMRAVICVGVPHDKRTFHATAGTSVRSAIGHLGCSRDREQRSLTAGLTTHGCVDDVVHLILLVNQRDMTQRAVARSSFS